MWDLLHRDENIDPDLPPRAATDDVQNAFEVDGVREAPLRLRGLLVFQLHFLVLFPDLSSGKRRLMSPPEIICDVTGPSRLLTPMLLRLYSW